MRYVYNEPTQTWLKYLMYGLIHLNIAIWTTNVFFYTMLWAVERTIAWR